nr:MAG TPA: hypothetical protein [Caudoviricetes sp.]
MPIKRPRAKTSPRPLPRICSISRASTPDDTAASKHSTL